MYRAFALSITSLTHKKHRAITSLLASYRSAVRFYIRSIWKTPGKLDKATLARLQSTRLSERFKSQALKQAIEVVIGTKLGAKALGSSAGRPNFHGPAQLDAKFVVIEPSKNMKTFDLVVRLSTLVKRERISIPLKGTTPLREALAVPGARLVQGVNLSENRIVFLVELPDVPLRTPDPPTILGLDVGYYTLVATSEGQLLGTDFHEIAAKIRRRKSGSKGKKRALLHRDAAVGESVNKLPFDSVDAIGVEDLKGIKAGKKNSTKTWRRARSPWPVKAVLERLKRRAAERGVRVVSVDPKNTSRTCPQCRHCAKENREKNVFRCVSCGYVSDADVVGAINVRAKAVSALVESTFEEATGESAVAAALKTKKGAKKAPIKKNNRRGVAFSTTTAVASTEQSDQGGRASPGRKSKSGPRGADRSRSDAPDSPERGKRSDAVRGRHARPLVVRSSGPLRSVESLGRRQSSDEIRRGG